MRCNAKLELYYFAMSSYRVNYSPRSSRNGRSSERNGDEDELPQIRSLRDAIRDFLKNNKVTLWAILDDVQERGRGRDVTRVIATTRDEIATLEKAVDTATDQVLLELGAFTFQGSSGKSLLWFAYDGMYTYVKDDPTALRTIGHRFDSLLQNYQRALTAHQEAL